MRKELEIETLEEGRQSLCLILMHKVVKGLVLALPTDAFVTSSKSKRQKKTKDIWGLCNHQPSRKTQN